MNDQSQQQMMLKNLNQMSQQPQMMNQVPLMNQPQVINQSQIMNQQMMMNQPQPQPPMMNRGFKAWSQQPPPLDPNMKFLNPMKPNYPGRSNWKGKKVTDNKRKDTRRMEKPKPSTSFNNSSSVSYQPPTLHELQSQNRVKARKFYPNKKFNTRFAPYAPRNTTSYLIRAKKAGGIASLVSPYPVTPSVLPTPILSPTREVLGDMAKEEWGVDGYGSMKGLIRLRSPGHEADVHYDEEEEDGGSSDSDHEHVEMERRLDHDLSRFEMIYPNYGAEHNNVLENRVDDQDSHIAQLEEENLILKERIFLMERELGDLRRRMLSLERQNQAVEDVNEEVVENGSDNDSEGGSDVPDMGIDNNEEMVDSVPENERNGNTEANVKLDNDGVSEAEDGNDAFMQESVPNESIAKKDEIRGNEMGVDFGFNEVNMEKGEHEDEVATEQCLSDKGLAKESDVKESGEFQMLDRNDESRTHEATDKSSNDLDSEKKDECENQVVGTSSETAGDDDLSVPH